MSLSAAGTNSPLAHVVVHLLQLELVVLILPPTGRATALALKQLALCGDGVLVVHYIPYVLAECRGILNSTKHL